MFDGDIISTDAYQIATEKMNNELANKYANYFGKETETTENWTPSELLCGQWTQQSLQVRMGCN